MIDHLLVFANEATAHQVLDPLGFGGTNDGVAYWDQSRVIPNVQIITSEAIWDNTDPQNPVLVSPQAVMPGWWINIRLSGVSTALRDLPGEICRLIADADAANAGQTFDQFVRYVSPSVDVVAIQSYRVAPVFAGSRYPFGV